MEFVTIGEGNTERRLHEVTAETAGEYLTPGHVKVRVQPGQVLEATNQSNIFHVHPADSFDFVGEVEEYDPGKHTVADVKSYLASLDDGSGLLPYEYQRVIEAEAAGKNRKIL